MKSGVSRLTSYKILLFIPHVWDPFKEALKPGFAGIKLGDLIKNHRKNAANTIYVNARSIQAEIDFLFSSKIIAASKISFH